MAWGKTVLQYLLNAGKLSCDFNSVDEILPWLSVSSLSGFCWCLMLMMLGVGFALYEGWFVLHLY